MYQKEHYEKAFELRKEGFTFKQIAKNLGVPSPTTIHDWIKKGKTPRGNFLKENFSKLSPTLAYILGVIEGDGYIRLSRTKGSIGLEVIDEDFAKEFYHRLLEWSGLKVSQGFNKNKNLYFTQLYSLRAATFLKNFDIYQLTSSNQEIKCAFLRGFFDSEGGVSASNLKTPRNATRFIAGFNSNKKLISLIKILLESVSIRVQNIDKRIGSGFNKKGINYRIRIGGRENLVKFNNLIGFSIERKNKKLKEALKSYKER